MDLVIAGFFATVSNSFAFPVSSLGEAAFSLHVYTQDQAKLIEGTKNPKLTVLGPPGTGKTWSLIRSAVKLYFDLKKNGKKGRILALTYNVAICKFIEDSLNKLITFESTEEKENTDIQIKVFTIDGFKKHLMNKMRGKIDARRRYRSGSTPNRSGSTPLLADSAPSLGDSSPTLWEEPEDVTEEIHTNDETFPDIFERYSDPVTGVSEKTLLDNFGYCGIFIDEVSYIC